jgi:hypothetical protein
MKRLKQFFLLLHCLDAFYPISYSLISFPSLNVSVWLIPYITQLIEYMNVVYFRNWLYITLYRCHHLPFLWLVKNIMKFLFSWLISRVDNISFRNLSILEYSGQICKHPSTPKVLKTCTSNICLSKVFGDILEKVIYFTFSSVFTK